MRAEHNRKHARHGHYSGEEPQRPPRLAPIAEGDLGDLAPPSLPPAWVAAGELVIALCHQGLASLPVVAACPVPGGQLLVRLRSIDAVAVPRQAQPVPGRDLLGNTGMGQSVHRDPV